MNTVDKVFEVDDYGIDGDDQEWLQINRALDFVVIILVIKGRAISVLLYYHQHERSCGCQVLIRSLPSCETSWLGDITPFFAIRVVSPSWCTNMMSLISIDSLLG